MVLYIPLMISLAMSGEEEPSVFFFIICGLMVIYSLAMLIPSLAVVVRRLHDLGKSGWFYFIGLIPIVGSIILLIWFFTEGQRGSNEYGPDPKENNFN